MTTGVHVWSKTASSNGSADSSINYAEGQAPSTLNDSARAAMARIAEYRDDNAGSLTTGGSSTAYTLTTNTGFTTLALLSGQRLKVRFNATNGATPTLNVDGLGAKSLYLDNATAIPTGFIKANSIWDVTYDNSIPAFIVNGIPAALPAGLGVAATLAATQSPMLFGRYSASAGNGQEITLGSGILMSGSGVLSAASSAGVTMINGTIAESNATNAATYAIKTLAGNDPSSADPVYFVFRNATASTGNYVVRTVTAALSLVIPSGATMGFTSNTPARIWIIAVDNAGTVELAVGNCLSGANIYPLGQFPIISTTAVDTSSDNAHVFYSTSAQIGVAYTILGYAEYAGAGVIVTAGTWNVDPLRIQLYGPGVPLPGQTIQTSRSASGSIAAGTTDIPYDNTIPQITEGASYFSLSITPVSACNLREIDATFVGTASNNVVLSVAIFLTGQSDALAATGVTVPTAGNLQSIPLRHTALFGSTSAQTISLRAGADSGSTQTNINGSSVGQKYGGVSQSYLRVSEIMA